MVRTLIGKVVSNKMMKTVVVEVERKFSHTKYRKVIIRHKKYKADSDNLKLEMGNIVEIQESRPISGKKQFFVNKKIDRTS